MRQLLLRITSTVITVSIPFSASAYSLHHFSYFKKSAPAQTSDIPLEKDEVSEEDQYQIWDTKCRDELGIPGGDVMGALRFNLNRCINTKQRQVNLSKRQRRGARRASNRVDLQSEGSQARREATKKQVNRSIVNKQRVRQSFTSSLPKTQREKQRSFQSFRSRERSQIRKKERSQVLSERAEHDAMIRARNACVRRISLDRATCIKEKKEEFLKAE